MKKTRLPALTAVFLLSGGGLAFPAASEWTRVEGAAVRVVLSANPDERGRLRGALQVDLEPGWKTYWRDPGDAGVPPSVTASARGEPGTVEIGFPPPGRHDDGYASWAGYDQPVALALTITAPQDAGPMDFAVFLGVCETICIPVQATFALERDRSGANADHESIVEKAFGALPETARPGFRILDAALSGDSMVVEAELPDGAAADLFLASTENRMFGMAEPDNRDGRTMFRVPVLSTAADTAEEVSYTLVSGQDAVSGTITIGE